MRLSKRQMSWSSESDAISLGVFWLIMIEYDEIPKCNVILVASCPAPLEIGYPGVFVYI